MPDSDRLAQWNALPEPDAAAAILPCCGAEAWAVGVAAQRPLSGLDELLQTSDQVWSRLDPSAWQQAFNSHPRIGEHRPPSKDPTAVSLAWSSEEQRRALETADGNHARLARANAQYEARFGRIFLICARGRSAAEILAELHRRLANDDETEWREGAEQQRQITALRLRRWMEAS